MQKILLSLALLSANAFAQNLHLPSAGNHQGPGRSRTYSTEIGKKYNDASYYTHPDFGVLPYDAPVGKNIVEDLSKRKSDERYYVDIDEPQLFYMQKSAMPINFIKDGKWLAIDASLKQDADMVYRANKQPYPTELNIAAKQSSIYIGSDYFRFNQYRLKIVKQNNQVEYQNANWDNISLTAEGCYITNAFPGIDMRIKYLEAAVKSEFIIKQNLQVKHLYFIDELGTSPSLALKLEENVLQDHRKGQLVVYDTRNDQIQIAISPARTYDSSGSKLSWFNPYILSGNQLELFCDSAILNGANTQYPVIVDPLVTVGPAANGSGALSGTSLSPAYCSNEITINWPAGTTPLDVSAGWSMRSNFCYGYYTGHGQFAEDCWQSESQVWLSTSCGGRSPVGTTNWNCTGCNSTGTWSPTVAFNSSGTQSLAQCFTPAAIAQSLKFTININRTNCNSYLDNDGCSPVSKSFCQTLERWSITVQGRNMETLGNSSTGNGELNVDVPCGTSYTMNPSVMYGAAPYTYSWSSGGSGATKVITPSIGGLQVHTVTVTDAANNSRTATFKINSLCTLPVSLISFGGKMSERGVALNWSTANEKGSDYYLIEKSEDGKLFEGIEKISAAGNSTTTLNYSTRDTKLQGNKIKYYRLKQVDKNGDVAYSEIIRINTGLNADKMQLIPNPVKNKLQVLLAAHDTAQDVYVEVYNMSGHQVVSKKFEAGQNIILDLEKLTKGSYIIRTYNYQRKPIASQTIIRE